MKTYKVYFEIKANRTEDTRFAVVEAENQKDACKKVKQAVFEKIGRNAFHTRCKLGKWYEQNVENIREFKI